MCHDDESSATMVRYLEMSGLAKKMKSATEHLPRGFSEANSSEICKRQHAKSQRCLSNQINTRSHVTVTIDRWSVGTCQEIGSVSSTGAGVCFLQWADFCLDAQTDILPCNTGI